MSELDALIAVVSVSMAASIAAWLLSRWWIAREQTRERFEQDATDAALRAQVVKPGTLDVSV